MAFNFGGNASSGEKKGFTFGNTATPAAAGPTNIFAGQNTTTPAGPPPSNAGFSFGGNAQTGPGSLFGNTSKPENKSMFGSTGTSGGFSFGAANANAATPAVTQSDASKAADKPSGFSFGTNSTNNTSFQSSSAGTATDKGPAQGAPAVSFANQTSTKPIETAPKAGGFSFGASPATTTNQGAGATTTKPATTGFSFGNTAAATSAATQPAASSGGFSFGNAGKTDGKTESFIKPASGAAAGSTLNFGGDKAEPKKDASTATSGFSFGTTKTDPKETPATSSGFSFGTTKPDPKEAPATSSGFSFGTTKTDPKETPATSSGFSFGGAKPEQKKEAAATTGFTFGATKAEDKKASSTVAAAPVSGGFSFGTTPAAGSKSTATVTEDSGKVGHGQSVLTGPTPVSLKNKTMEDLINKWSGDLDKYSQDFQKQAKQISTWDQALLSSGDQISRLYAVTVEAEQQSSKVDQALNYIENQQDELSQVLDSYESQVRDITAEVGVNQPADQEREKAYSQAEQLVGDLDGLGKKLGQMIDELNKSGEIMSRLKEDDPLSAIIKVLNSQLQSLSWIDETATKLNDKVDQLGAMQQQTGEAGPKTPTGSSSMSSSRFRFGSLRME